MKDCYGRPIRKIPPTHTHFFPNGQNTTKHNANLTTCDIEFKANQEKKHVEGGIFLPDTLVDSSNTMMRVQSGLTFILDHFSGPLFPRRISTASTRNRQKEVDDSDRAMLYFQASLWEDCRIAAFGVGQTNPNLIFIELDARDFVSMKALKTALTKTLKNIKDKLGGFPTVYWSGRGFHVIQPIDCPVNLDEVKEFADLTPYPNNKFLQFAERYLSNGKCDSGNHPAIRSCMLRVPYTLNLKCKEAGIDAEVKIIQKWDGYRPDYILLRGSFYAYLVGERERELSRYQDAAKNYASGVDYGPISWIEKLLQTPTDDFRKRSRDVILVPYLVVRRGMTDVEHIHNIVMQWADKCGELYRLEPTRHEYSNRVRSRIYEVIRDRIPYMSLERLKEKNPGLYEKLTSR
jgi:hypothetical protein